MNSHDNPPWPTTAKPGATWGPYKLGKDGWWRLKGKAPQDREFAVKTSALWKEDMDNYAYCCPPFSFAQHRSYHRAERIQDGKEWTRHGLQEINFVK